ncbi:glycosyltransferase [Hymenobacter psychrophilus]|uniref:Glycosyl transferase 4-like domain-containing protein n=1 Tax=Hymenobacter psychrophilus TaxID=651662 RepID=A0A1H3GRH1_9BACT|nr:glycosyltransferase [Hymenobacter psychrophilus]SDY05871.1 Glycosyl transferase 4-like domain-containing protein [Hymenobacter psychrophilus]
MSTASSRILLLGWNEALRPQEAAALPLRALVQQLAPLASLAVLLPHEPQPPFAATEGAVRITGLAELDLVAILATARPNTNPAAWQAPAAPYIGSSLSAAGWQVPAAPYQGATPGTPAPPAGPPAPGSSAALSAEPAHPLAAAESDSPPVSGRPDYAGPAEDASIAAAHNTTEQPPSAPSTSAVPAPDDAHDAAARPAALPPMQVHATLAQELAALGHNPPDATAANLNFQVIQYARFATSWACGKQFAVIYAVDWPTWLAAMEIRQLTGWPLVLHVHSLAHERAAPTETGWAVALERLALRRADLVLAASTKVASQLTERYQLAPERLRTVSVTNTAAINELLHHIEHHRPGRPPVAPITPPSS